MALGTKLYVYFLKMAARCAGTAHLPAEIVAWRAFRLLSPAYLQCKLWNGWAVMDCTSKCRLARHAELVFSAITREDLPTLQKICKCVCANAVQLTDASGRSALHVAASCNKPDVLEWLIRECGVDVDSRDGESGWSALHRSVFYGHVACAVKLLKVWRTSSDALVLAFCVHWVKFPHIWTRHHNHTVYYLQFGYALEMFIPTLKYMPSSHVDLWMQRPFITSVQPQ